MDALGQTTSTCQACRALVPAKVVTDGTAVFFRKFCRDHGESLTEVNSDVADYLRAQRCVKPAWQPRAFSGRTAVGCPEGCGFCSRHEQHLCLPIVEITSRCDLACPCCLVSATRDGEDLTPETFAGILDSLIVAEERIDVLNLSGGEPLLHPQLMELVEQARARPEIVRVSVSTSGLTLLDRPELLHELVEHDVVISLQLDGFDDRAYRLLRGRPLLEAKRQILELLSEDGATTSLTMTLAGGVNQDQLRPVLDYFFETGHVVSLMIQPLALVGRGQRLAPSARRLTIPDVIAALGRAGHPAVRADDFFPLPCSHPLCFSLAYYLRLRGGGVVSVSQLVEKETLMDVLANRTIAGLDAEAQSQIKDLIYRLWSGPAGYLPNAPEVLATMRDLLRRMSTCCFDARSAFRLGEEQVKTIFIHAFQDEQVFDLARVRRCCNGYPQADGRVVPACVHNVLRRRRERG